MENEKLIKMGLIDLSVIGEDDDRQENNVWVEFFDFKKKYHHNYGSIKIDRNLIEIHTGGWSENEDLLIEFKKSIFYLLYFSHMTTGGHYYLDTDKNNMDTKHWRIIKE